MCRRSPAPNSKSSPATRRVRYGDGLDIYAKPIGAPVERLELVLSPVDEERRKVKRCPMFPEPDGRWRAVLAKVTAPAEYFVRAHQARSRKIKIDVQSVPEIEKVEVKVVPPAYTADATYVGPVPKDGIAGLPGAKVELKVTSNRPLSSGTMQFKLADGTTSRISMNAVTTGGQEVAGQFEIKTSGKLELRVTDVENQESRDSFNTSITRLTDERPFIRIIQPREASLATPTANLPVEISAEDDYGISRVQLFRSLNDSRPLPMDVRSPPKPPRRLAEKVFLPYRGTDWSRATRSSSSRGSKTTTRPARREPKARSSASGSFRRKSSSRWSACGRDCKS